jgi:hypothetical protein
MPVLGYDLLQDRRFWGGTHKKKIDYKSVLRLYLERPQAHIL